MKRRDFLKGMPAAVVGLGVGASGVGGMGTGGPRPPGPRSAPAAGADMVRSARVPNATRAALPENLGVQLYTLRGPLQSDAEATLAALADIGYREVERAGLLARPVADWRGMLGRAGLRAVSSHHPLSAVLDGSAVDEAMALGQSWVVVPSLDADRHSPEGYLRTVDDFHRAGERCNAAGLRFAFHNHAREFEVLADGTRGFDTLVGRTDPARVSFQLDVFWAAAAGADPVALMETHQARFSSLHMKDRTADGTMVEVGSGVLDFGAMLARADAAGVEHLFVEHDQPADALQSVWSSFRALERLLNQAR